MGGGRQPKCGFGLAATPASCNHSQPLECMGETGEIYLFILGVCGQWVFLMKTTCFCVFPENIIPRGKRYPLPFSDPVQHYVGVHTHRRAHRRAHARARGTCAGLCAHTPSPPGAPLSAAPTRRPPGFLLEDVFTEHASYFKTLCFSFTP